MVNKRIQKGKEDAACGKVPAGNVIYISGSLKRDCTFVHSAVIGSAAEGIGACKRW